MPKAVYHPRAFDDLFEIWSYIADQSKSMDVADRLIDQIDDAVLLYATNPQLGELRPDLAEGIRCFVVSGYVVL